MENTKEKRGLSQEICFEIGQRIRKYRLERGITQECIAEKLDISESHYCNIENGHRTCTLQNLITICEILGVTSDQLLQGCIRIENTEEESIEQLLKHLDGEVQAFVRQSIIGYTKQKRGEDID